MILKDFSLDNIKQVIQDDFPEFEVKTINPIINGWDNFVVEINGEYIFRFPKDDGCKTKLEIQILNFLKDKITLPIPIINFTGKSYLYTGYKKIIGEKLSKDLLDSLSTQERDKLVFDIANFFHEFHTSFPIERAREMKIEEEDHFSYSNLINKNIFKKIKDEKLVQFINEALEKYAQIKKAGNEISVLYNDLHEDNVAFDIKNRRLNGIFDFGDVAIEDVNREFAYLSKIDPQFMEEVASRYEQISGRKIDLKRVMTYAKINEMSDLAEYIDRPKSTIYKKTLANITKWMNNEKKYAKHGN